MMKGQLYCHCEYRSDQISRILSELNVCYSYLFILLDETSR